MLDAGSLEIVGPVSRGRKAIALAAGCSAALLAGSAHAQAGHLVKGELHTDGVLTVGQQETAIVKALPPRMKLRVEIAPPDDLDGCGTGVGIGSCFRTPLYPAAGSPAFRTSSTGRAVVTFVMPRTYPFSGTTLPGVEVHELPFRNGQKVWLQARGLKNYRLAGGKTRVRGMASGSGVVDAPPAP